MSSKLDWKVSGMSIINIRKITIKKIYIYTGNLKKKRITNILYTYVNCCKKYFFLELFSGYYSKFITIFCFNFLTRHIFNFDSLILLFFSLFTISSNKFHHIIK